MQETKYSNSTWQMIRNLAGEFFAVGLFICIVQILLKSKIQAKM